MKQIFTFFILSVIVFSAISQPFTAGNLVVVRVGDGTAPLINTGNAVFLDEYSPGGIKIKSIALPTTVSGANKSLILSGTASSEGALTRSADGRFLTLAGYSTTTGGATSLSTTTGAVVPRVVAIIKNDASINTTTTFTDFASGNNPRGAYSNDGVSVWMVSGVKGLQYNTIGSVDTCVTVSNKTSTAATLANLRTVNEFGGQLYISTGSGSTVRIGSVGNGLPINAGNIITTLPGLPVANPSSPYAFFLAKLPGSSANLNVLYVSDDNTNGVGGIKKYSLNSTTNSWDSVGIIDYKGVYRGLTGVVSGGIVTLYAVRNSDSLVSIVDNAGFNAPPSSTNYTVLAAAATNTAFRGVALAPTLLPLANNNFVLSAVLENNIAKLTWSTEDMQSINNFIIEKSINGKDFSVLQEIKVNSSSDYSIIDNQFTTTSYYRIKAIRLNGLHIYSNTTVLSSKKNIVELQLYPNPTQDFIVVHHPRSVDNAILRITNGAGNIVLERKLLVGANDTYISVAEFTSGNYTVSYLNKNIHQSSQFIKK